MPAAKFKTIEELNSKIDEYFKNCIDNNLEPNKAGLRLHLEITKETYSAWKRNDNKYSDSIKRADNIIEDFWIRRLGQAAATGAIFYLKNAFKEDYKDRQEVDHTTDGKPLYLPAELLGKNGASRRTKKDSTR